MSTEASSAPITQDPPHLQLADALAYALVLASEASSALSAGRLDTVQDCVDSIAQAIGAASLAALAVLKGSQP